MVGTAAHEISGDSCTYDEIFDAGVQAGFHLEEGLVGASLANSETGGHCQLNAHAALHRLWNAGAGFARFPASTHR